LRVWKLVKALGERFGVPELHPHAFRHTCGTELLRRTKGSCGPSRKISGTSTSTPRRSPRSSPEMI
jgi:integrase